MIIEKISLKNYRQYRDAQITFSYGDGSRRFTVIQGSMGSGKTNLLNSISWCLYGKERHISDKYRALPIVNTLALADVKKGKNDEVRVEMVMRDDENKKIIFIRHFRFKKEEGNTYDILQDFNLDSKTQTIFDVYTQVNKDLIPVSDPAIYANRVFPEDIQEYFFFDGERLDDYFRTVSYEKVKDEVFRISQLDILENEINHLDKVAKGYAFEAKGINPKADQLKIDIDKLDEEIGPLEKEIENVKKDKESANKLKEEYVEKLRNYPSSKDVVEAQKRRDEIDKEYKNAESSKKDNEEERLDYVTEIAPVLLVSGAIKSAYEAIEKKIKAGEIPPKIKKDFLESIIRNDKCICKRDLDKDKEAKAELLKLLKECEDLDELSLELSDEKTKLKTALDKIGYFKNNLEKMNRMILIDNTRLEDLEKESAKIHEKLKKYDIEDIRQLEDEYEVARSQFEEKATLLGRYLAERDRKKAILESKRIEWQREIKQGQKKNKITKSLIFCEEGLEEIRKIKEEIMEELRAEIEEKTEKQFFELIWKKYNFKSVNIDESWKFSVQDSSGRETIGSFSAGERQCLALSFLAALNIVSGFNFPIIMDTPLARISKVPRLNIAAKLPTYLKEKQVIMLLTDEEYTTEVRDVLKKNVGMEYKINFHDSERGCESTMEKL